MSGWPQPALPVQWAGTANLPPFVGRRREFELLESVWQSVEQGARQVVFVGGEPGAGKSRLAREAAVALNRVGVAVLVGSCSADLGQPFDPLAQPAQTLLAAVEAGELELTGGGGVGPDESRRLLRLLTAGSVQVPSGVGTTGTPAAAPAAATVAPVAFRSVVTALRAASRVRPLLLVLEDLHWAGESGLRVLRHVVEQSEDLPMLVLGTCRTSRPDRSELLSAVVADLVRQPGVQRVDLGGLDTNEVAEYLDARRAAHPDELRQDEVRPHAVLLRDHTGGNPFLLREVCRELEQRDGFARMAQGRIAVPDSVRAVMAGRLAELTGEQRELVGLGAVVGESFAVDLVRAAAARAGGGPSISAAEVFGALAAATARGILETDPGRAGQFRFPHALARQAVLDSLGAFELASAHARVGFALEAGATAAESRVQRLAHHFSQAGGLGLEERAEHYLELAAETAVARLANSDAAMLFERAAGFAVEPARRDQLLLRAAQCHHVAGHMARAREIDDQVATVGDPAHRVAAAVGFEAASWRGGARADHAVALLRSALAARGGDDSDPEVVRALGALGRAFAMSGQRDEGREHHVRALALARASGDEALLAAVLETAMHSYSGVDGLRNRASLADELIALSKRRGDLGPVGAAASLRCHLAYVLGDPVSLETAFADLTRMVRETHDVYWHWTTYLILASRRIMACDFVGAAEAVAEARRLEGRFEQGSAHDAGDGPWSLQSFMLRRETSGLDFARLMLDRLGDIEKPWRPGLVALLTELGLAERARPHLREAVERDLPTLRPSASWPASLSFLGEAAAHLREREALEVLLPDAEVFAGLNLLGSEMLATVGSGDRLLAVMKSALSLPGVDDHFAAALEMDSRMGSPLHVATTQAEWAVHLRRSHAATAEVERHAAPARELADRHGLVRVRRILGPMAGLGRARLPDGLTTRELDVLRLIGEGRSNRDIASALFISENTAANHVRSILMKTQSGNRTAAAHYAMRHGLLVDGGVDGGGGGGPTTRAGSDHRVQ